MEYIVTGEQATLVLFDRAKQELSSSFGRVLIRVQPEPLAPRV